MSAPGRKTGGVRFHTPSVKDAASWLRDYLTAIKHGQFHPYTPLERKVREATRNEAWGPTGTILNELAEASCESDLCQIIYAVLETRLQYPPEKWRNVYKTLQVLEFLMKRGSAQCVMLAQTDLRPHVTTVQDFEYTGSDGRDYGINVRVRAAAILRLLDSDQELQQERSQLQRRAKQFKGYSREDLEHNQEFMVEAAKRSCSWPAGRAHEDRDVARGHVQLGHQGEDRMGRPRQAGQMKGVSEEERLKNQRILKVLLANKGNRRCADCISDQRPTWASINCGVFICMKCAGIHRGLGVHVSQVRSCNLDSWKTEQVVFMSQTGNRVANTFWEAKMPPNLKPRSDDPSLASFIRRKYEHREWAEGSWPPVRTNHANENIQPAVVGAPQAQVTAGPETSKQQHLKPPRQVAFIGQHTPLEISGSPFEEAASALDEGNVPAELEYVAAKPALSAPVRAMSADPLSPSEAAVVSQPPPVDQQRSGIMRTQTFPDLLDFGDDPIVLRSPSPVPRVEQSQPRVQGREPIDSVAALAELDYHPSLLDTWIYDPLASGNRVLGLESVDSAEVIRTTEMVYEDESVIHTTEFNLDDADPQPSTPFVSSADAQLQTAPRSENPWLQEQVSWMDVQDMAMESQPRQLATVGRSAGQKRDTREGRSGADGGHPKGGASTTPHVSVILTVTDSEGGDGPGPAASSQSSALHANRGPRTGQWWDSVQEPGYILETVASLKDMGQLQQPKFAGGTASGFPNASVMRWASGSQGATGNLLSATMTHPFVVPEHPRSGHHAAVKPAYKATRDPLSDLQPLGVQSIAGTAASSTAPATIASTVVHASSAWTDPRQLPGLGHVRVPGHHGFSGGDVGVGRGEGGSNFGDQFSAVFVSHSHSPSPLSYNATDQAQTPSGTFFAKGGARRSGFGNSPAEREVDVFRLPNASQAWASMGGRSPGGGTSSGGASDELERLLFNQVENLARENEKIAARAARMTVSPHKGISMREMRAQLAGASGSPSSGSTGRSLSVGVE